MSKRNQRIEISSLLNKYKSNEVVVSEIEKSLISLPVLKTLKKNLIIDSLYDEKLLVDTQKYLNKNKLSIVEPYIVYKENNQYYLINNLYKFVQSKDDENIPIYVIDINREDKIKFIYYYLDKGNYNILFLTYFFNSLNKHGYDDKTISIILNISISQIRNIKRLNELDISVLNALKEDKISYTIARNLVNLEKDTQKKLSKKILDEKLSNRAVESLRREIQGKSKDVEVNIKNNTITLTFNSSREAKEEYQKLFRKYH